MSSPADVQAAANPAQTDSGESKNEFATKVEKSIEAVVTLMVQYAATYTTIFVKPQQMIALLSSEGRGQSLPPLAFLLTAYFTGTTTGALLEPVVGGRWDEIGYPKLFRALGEQIGSIEIDPVKLLFLALPVMLTLLVISFIGAAVTRTDRKTVTAFFAYTTGFVWTTAALLLMLGLVIAPLARAADALWIEVIMALVVWISIVLLGLSVIAVIVWIVRSTAWCIRGKRRIWRGVSAMILSLGAVAVCAVETLLGVQALGQKFTHAPPAFTVEVNTLALEFSGSVWEAPSSIAWFTGTFGNDGLIDSAASPIPLQVVAVVANHSDSTLLLDRRNAVLQLGFYDKTQLRLARDATVRLSCIQQIPLQVMAWSDGDAPVMVLGKGETKWIRLGGQVGGFRTTEQLKGFSYMLRIHGLDEGEPFHSQWYTIKSEHRTPDPCFAAP